LTILPQVFMTRSIAASTELATVSSGPRENGTKVRAGINRGQSDCVTNQLRLAAALPKLVSRERKGTLILLNSFVA
jgi:hypothetical protein